MLGTLKEVLHGFDKNPVKGGQLLRQLLDDRPEDFATAAFQLLREGPAGLGEHSCRYMVSLLASRGVLPRALYERGRLTREDSVRIARVAAKFDPSLHVTLLRHLMENRAQGQALRELDPVRMLEIVEAVSAGSGAMALVSQLLRHPDGRVRSKAALLLGRGNRNPHFAERLMTDEDGRVRANALEALWGLRDEETIRLFRQGVDESHHRIVANSLVGLYRAGLAESIELLVEKAAHPDIQLRRAVVWALGETRDPRFQPLLARMLKESVGELRSTVFRARAKSGRRRLARQPVRACP